MAAGGSPMNIPAAEWSESDEGAKALVASSAGAEAELEVPKDGKGDAWLCVNEHGDQGSVLVSADGARATIAVLTRWLKETLPEPAGHPPHLLDREPEGMVVVTDSMREYRGWRYIRCGDKWHRTHQIPAKGGVR